MRLTAGAGSGRWPIAEVCGLALLAAAALVGGRLRARKVGGLDAVRHRLLLRHLPLVHWTTDTALRVTSCGGLGLRDLERREEQVVGQLLAEVLGDHPAAAAVLAAHRQALAGEVTEAALAHQGPPVRLWVEPLRAADGRVVGTIGLALLAAETTAG
jgi:hypothetical protein